MEKEKILTRLDRIESEIKGVRFNLKARGSLMSLAGRWKDLRTKNAKGPEELKKEIYDKRKGKSRRFSV